jgi:hypothetical protein
MLFYLPAWPFVGQEIHVQSAPAPAGADHRGLLKEAIILDDIKNVKL